MEFLSRMGENGVNRKHRLQEMAETGKNLPDAALDEFDRRILRALQRDATMPLLALAEEVRLSSSPCWRRVKRLRDAGYLRAEVALVDARKVGLGVSAYIHVSLLDHTEPSIRKLDELVQRSSQVLECATITGADDYLLKVVARDPEDLERFIMKELLALGVVRSSTTHFVLRQTKSTTVLPV